MAEPVGTCYPDAWRYLIKQEEGELVHGTILRGVRLGHAWVELPTGYIWEPKTGEYYTPNGFTLNFNPQEDHRYTVEEAAIMAAKTGNYGPWSDEERRKFLKRSGNPGFTAPGGKTMELEQRLKAQEERLKRGRELIAEGKKLLGEGRETLALLPMPPTDGPPLPRGLRLKWPWKE